MISCRKWIRDEDDVAAFRCGDKSNKGLKLCPECIEKICPKVTCPSIPNCPTTCPPCEQTCKGCGSGGGSINTCPACINCDVVNVVAYTDTGKYFCDGVGADASCLEDETLEMPWG